MTESNHELPFEERMRQCPIHRWADVDGYLKRTQVPPHLWESFHELIVARGQFSWHISDIDAKKFGQEARAITEKHELMPREAFALKMVFEGLVHQWMVAKEREQ